MVPYFGGLEGDGCIFHITTNAFQISIERLYKCLGFIISTKIIKGW